MEQVYFKDTLLALQNMQVLAKTVKIQQIVLRK